MNKWLVALLILLGLAAPCVAGEVYDTSPVYNTGRGPAQIIVCSQTGCKKVANPSYQTGECVPNPNAEPFPTQITGAASTVAGYVPGGQLPAIGLSVLGNFGARAADGVAACDRWGLFDLVGNVVLSVADAFAPVSQLMAAKNDQERGQILGRAVVGQIPVVGTVVAMKEMADNMHPKTAAAVQSPGKPGKKFVQGSRKVANGKGNAPQGPTKVYVYKFTSQTPAPTWLRSSAAYGFAR
jgi:hypothetical protein